MSEWQVQIICDGNLAMQGTTTNLTSVDGIDFQSVGSGCFGSGDTVTGFVASGSCQSGCGLAFPYCACLGNHGSATTWTIHICDMDLCGDTGTHWDQFNGDHVLNFNTNAANACTWSAILPLFGGQIVLDGCAGTITLRDEGPNGQQYVVYGNPHFAGIDCSTFRYVTEYQGPCQHPLAIYASPTDCGERCVLPPCDSGSGSGDWWCVIPGSGTNSGCNDICSWTWNTATNKWDLLIDGCRACNEAGTCNYPAGIGFYNGQLQYSLCSVTGSGSTGSGSGQQECLFLTTDQLQNFEIVGGPYDNEMDCDVHCNSGSGSGSGPDWYCFDFGSGSGSGGCCLDTPPPDTLFATFGGALAILGTIMMTLDGVNPDTGNSYSGSSDLCGTCSFTLDCQEDGTWISIMGGLGGESWTSTSEHVISCSPFYLFLNNGVDAIGPCAGPANVIITE